MDVILKEDVKALGKKGQLVKVSDGYARNYLLPRNLAIEATASNLNVLKNREQAEENKLAKEKEQALEQKKALENAKVTIKAKGGTGGKLFGSITSKEIADAIMSAHKVNIDKKKINLKDTIKSFGEYTIEIKLYPEVTAQITVSVTE